jgi:drug/metabolite transporter (DMT)-like permease
MLFGSFFFAAMSLFTESLGDEYSFTWIAFIRSAIATLVAVAMVWLGGAKLVFFRPATLWLRSLAGCTSMMFLFFAMTHYDVSVILSLSSTYPIWVAVLGWPMLGHIPSRDTWIALAVSTIGMWLVYSAAIGSDPTKLHGLHSMPQYAIPSGIMAGLLSAVALIGLHKVKEVDTRAVVAHFSAVSTIISLFLWLVIPHSEAWLATDSTSPIRLTCVGVAAVLGQLFLTKAFASGVPARVSVVGLSQVAFAATYKWLVGGDIPSMSSFAGMILVVGATLWVMLASRRSADDSQN